MRLEQVLHKLRPSLQEEAKTRELAERVFKEWRARYVDFLCQHIRNVHYMREQQLRFVEHPTAQWANTAVHILTIAPVDIQDFFLRANEETKSQLVEAVLQDRGVTDLSGHFSELPPL